MISQQYFQVFFGQAYGQGSYNASSYNGEPAASTAALSSDGASSSGGVLADTGFAVMAAVTLACLIIFVSVLIKFWKRPAHK